LAAGEIMSENIEEYCLLVKSYLKLFENIGCCEILFETIEEYCLLVKSYLKLLKNISCW
jgi:hypothetical protein